MKTNIYDITGKSTGSVDLPESVFDVAFNNELVHQVYVSMTSNQRYGTASTKDRAEVRGGGKKPWAQKGTGRARHGSIRSPIWRGGGVTHGPTTERNWDKKINKKMKDKALFSVLSQKLRDGEVIFVDSFSWDAPKTKDAQAMLENLAKVEGFEGLASKTKNRALITDVAINENNIKSFANFSNIKTEELRKLNILDLLQYKYLVIISPQESIETLSAKLA